MMMCNDDRPFIRTYYVNRVVDLPPLVGQAAFDSLLDRTDLSDGARYSILIGSPELRLRYGRQAIDRCPSQHGPYRVEEGVLHAKSRRMDVDLELWPWSSDRVELGLRPVRRGITTWPSDGCMRAAHQALERLSERMRYVADQPLRSLTRTALDEQVV